MVTTQSPLLDERALSKLKWRCRRGLLENDLFIERFFARHEAGLTVRQAEALGELMDLSDNDLLDLLLGRKTPEGALAKADTVELLALLRQPPENHSFLQPEESA
jgi:antitoxin CptB